MSEVLATRNGGATTQAAGGAGVAAAFEESVPTVVHAGLADAMETGLLTIECGFVRGFAGLQLIGNASEVCRDGKERARAALEALGIHIPAQRLVVSLTPADVKKDGNHFDLPVAVSLDLLITQRPARVVPARWLFAAELGLDGELRPVRGVVAFTIAAMAAGLEGLVIAAGNVGEVAALTALAEDVRVQVRSFRMLGEVLAWLHGESEASAGLVDLEQVASEAARRRESGEGDERGTRSGVRRLKPAGVAPESQGEVVAVGCGGSDERARRRRIGVDFDDMILTPDLELAAVAVCAGDHSLLLCGAPGTGKSMLSARLPSILPPLARDEHIDAMRIYSTCAERLPDALLQGRPPFRAPHHQASAAAILGTPELPGELSLAHGGILFLDELPEFRRDLLESLREPLETGEIRVSRSRKKVVWQARVVLVAACNNCPCGWAGSTRKECKCSQGRLFAYRARLSGPILERIDLHVNMPEPDDATASLFLRLESGDEVSRTEKMARAVVLARQRAAERNARFGVVANASLKAQHMIAASGLPSAAFAEMVNAVVPNTVSSRSALRCLRVARTLADVAGREAISEAELRQAWRWHSQNAARDRGEVMPPHY